MLQNRNFRLHWASVAFSQIGSFFTTIALPWLVLTIANDDPISMTTVLAAGSISNGFFILAGGGLADRFSPMRTLLVSRIAFVLVMASLAVLTWLSFVPLWLLTVYAVVLGTLGAVGVPASQSLLPAILKPSELGHGNGVIMGTLQVAQMVGPILAGWLLWFSRRLSGVAEGSPEPASIAAAFAVDASLVLVAVVLMSFMKVAVAPSPSVRVLELLREGVRFCWRQTGIRLVIGYLVLVSFFLHGPLMVGLPLLTKLTLGMHERGLGVLYSMIGCGTILGVILAALTKPSARRLGAIVLCCDLVAGIAFTTLGRVDSGVAAGALLLLLGGGLGFTMVAGTTWFQTRTPPEYMGRVMSFVMFALYGLAPLSGTIAGYLIDATSVGQVISGAGLVIAAVSGVGLLIPRVRRMGDLPAYPQATVRVPAS
ncbi:MFS transporter [Sorangium sp. So ce131]|uniref:MFS transporter n=1 Tax=Sorangium sp. So ce131 TaxID=3133282 RepID=UPI003F63511B